jgi:hypothetical protein
MAGVFYNVPAGQQLIVHGPAGVTVQGNEAPVIGTKDTVDAPPILTQLVPSAAAIGDPPVVMTVNGSGFTSQSIIVFNGGDEPTTFVSDTELSTVIKPSLASAPGTVPVTVRNGPLVSEPRNFMFTSGGGGRA